MKTPTHYRIACPICAAPKKSPCVEHLCTCGHDQPWHREGPCEDFVSAATATEPAVRCSCSAFVPGSTQPFALPGAVHAARAAGSIKPPRRKVAA